MQILVLAYIGEAFREQELALNGNAEGRLVRLNSQFYRRKFGRLVSIL